MGVGYSNASDIVPGDTNGHTDVFWCDRATGRIERVSVSSSGAQANRDTGSNGAGISPDGRVVAFVSDATNLVPGDTNGQADAFVHDMASGRTERVSVSTSGEQANGPSDGRDLAGYSPSLSTDGRYVAFQSRATNLVSGDANGHQDVFVRDRVAGTTKLVSIARGGATANGDSEQPAISGGGRYVVWDSVASNLVRGDTNTTRDVFRRDLAAGRTIRGSVSSTGQQGNYGSGGVPPGPASVTPDGRFVVFSSLASDLVPGDPANRRWDVFVRGPLP